MLTLPMHGVHSYVHAGMRIYYRMFLAAWRTIKDFILWFVYVMLVLASVVLAVFQLSGGNPDFALRLEALSSIARLTFGMYDYDT